MPEPRYDLHTHTVFSDGTTTPEENAALAAAEGLAGLALTDHDTTEGWRRMAAACEQHGLEFIPGLEFSTELSISEGSIHILGYWVDPDDPALVEECDRLRNERLRRAQAIVDRLCELGATVAWADVVALAGDAPVGRPHIAQVMVDCGLVIDIEQAFDDFLADGGPAWVPKHALAPERGVELIVAAGGAAVLAHPASSLDLGPETDALLDRLCAAGLAGLEARHPSYDEVALRTWSEVARRRELLPTGSSDFHGARKPVRMGAETTPVDVVESLRAYASR